MEKEKVVRISYDDQPDEVVEKMSEALRELGVSVERVGGGDGWQEYRLVRQHPGP